MTKEELIEETYFRADWASKKAVSEIVNTMLDCIAETLAEGEQVELGAFGRFSVRQRSLPEGGTAGPSVAKRVSFRPGSQLWDALAS